MEKNIFSSNNKLNVCMIAYRTIPEDVNRVKIARSVNKNYNVDFICLKKREQKSEEIMDSISLFRIKNDSNINSYTKLFIDFILFTVKAFVKILQLSRTKKYSFFHIHNPPDFLILAVIPFKFLYGSKIILDLHDMLPESVASNLNDNSILERIAKIIERFSIYFSDAIISTNLYDKQIIFSRNNVDLKKIYVVMNTPNLKQLKIHNAKKEDYNFAGKYIVLFEGTIWKRRGIQTIINSIELLKQKIPILFIIVGNGPDFDFLQKLVTEKNLNDYVLFTGWVNLDELSKYISISDVCTIPFLQTKVNDRGVPNKLFEYIVHEKPIVASKLKGLSLTFSENEVLFYDPGSAEDAARKILWCYNNPVEVKNMVFNAKKRYEKEYTWEKMEQVLYKCYEDLTYNK